MTAIDIQIIAYGLLGLILVYSAKKRRHDRTTLYGTEQFKSYRHKVGSRLLDALLWGLGFGGLVSAALLVIIEYAPAWGFLMMVLAVAYAFEKDYYSRFRRN
jgi:hypothetical protein